MGLNQYVALFNPLDKSCEFFGDLDVPNHYNKTEIDAIDDEWSSLLFNTYTKTEVYNLLTNIILVGYYTETEIDTQLKDYATISYLQNNHMTTLSIT